MRRRLAPFAVPLVALAASLPALAPAPSLAEEPARRSLMDTDTRAAIERGLRFLARTQNADGSWTCDAGNKVNDEYLVNPKGRNVHHVGVTALGILAFLAAGHTPGRGPYGTVVEKAVGFTLSRVQPSGFVAADETRMYSHAFATLALAEVYGQSRASELRDKLQSAVEFTVKCQNDTGGWRYVPFSIETDMSVTVCQVVALRAARNVGIKVPQSTIDRALHYVIESAITSDALMGSDEVGAFYYQPPAGTRYNRSSFALTAAGLNTLFQAGLYDDAALARYVKARGIRKNPPPSVVDTVNYLRSHYRQVRHFRGGRHYYYFYGNYYAAQAMYNVGGQEPRRWEGWYDMVRKDLLDMQQVGQAPDGAGPTESWWASNVGSTHAYATSVAILILSMPFDYLPIHQR